MKPSFQNTIYERNSFPIRSMGEGVCIFAMIAGLLIPIWAVALPELRPVVEVEEEVYQYAPADNGAGPLWCRGSTCLVRVGNDVFASGLKTLEGVPPLNNCRWMFFHRTAEGWKRVAVDEKDRTREPCPLAAFQEGPVFLSVNPTLVTDRQAEGGGPARPEILVFNPAHPAGGYETLLPVWDGTPAFTEHSYRSFAADGVNREFILFQNIGYTHAEWTFRDRDGHWAGQGKLEWPWGAEYDEPKPVRVCYPNVAIKDRVVHFCGVSDVVEPYAKWRAFKKELTGNEWDYDFRRLFYTWTTDITKGAFEEWAEIASRDKTCGWVMPGDLWVGPDGTAHLVWTEQAIDERLREKFFPDAVQRHEMNYAVVKEGKVIKRQTLVAREEGTPGVRAIEPRFHVTPDNRLLVFYYLSEAAPETGFTIGNYLMEIGPDGVPGVPVAVQLEYPMSNYFTATIRGGSPPAEALELLGARDATTMGYARIRLDKEPENEADTPDDGKDLSKK